MVGVWVRGSGGKQTNCVHRSEMKTGVIIRRSNQSKTFMFGLSCSVDGAERGDVQTLRGGTTADVTRYKRAGNVRKQEIVSTKVRLQSNLKEPALMVHLGAEILAMQLVIRQLPPGLRPGFLMRRVCWTHISLWCMSIGGHQCRPPSACPPLPSATL
jgi:hypothetical protein